MIAAIILYLIALCVTVYDKYCVMLDLWEKPGLYRRPVSFILFSTVKWIILVAYCVLFYLFSGLILALGSIIFHFLFGSVLLRIFFRKRVAIWYPRFVKVILGEQREGDPPLPDAELEKQAMSLAQKAALKAMRNET